MAKKVETIEGAIIGWEAIGPGEAEKLLAENTHNRVLNYSTITEYAADMREGNWMANGESIKVAEDGTLIDGQHRLHAVVASGATCIFLVVRGLEMETQKTVDAGRKRSVASILGMDGIGSGPAVATLARRALAWQAGHRRSVTRPRPVATNSQVLDFFAEHPELERIAKEGADTARKAGMPTALATFSQWLFEQVDEKDSQDFFEKLRSGADMPAGHPVMALRRIAIEQAANRNHRMQDWLWLAYVIKGWNFYRDGAEVQFIRMRLNGSRAENYPEPR